MQQLLWFLRQTKDAHRQRFQELKTVASSLPAATSAIAQHDPH